MNMVWKRDFNKAELETVRVSKNPTTVVTANGEVLTKEEATVFVKELDLFVTVMLLENTSAVLSEGSSRIMGTHTTGRVVKKPHLIKTGRKINCNTANNVPLVVLGLSTSSSSSSSPTSPTSSSQETVTPTEHPASTRSETTSETRRMNQQKPKTQIKIRTTKNYRMTSCKVCQIGYRSSGMDRHMKVFLNTETLPVLLMFYLWSREQKWYRVSTGERPKRSRYFIDREDERF